MDISDSLKYAENSLRDLLNFILSKQFGADWFYSCGVSDKRIEQWEERKNIDEKKFGYSDPRIIYYADFYDLKTILKKCWDKGFSDVFGKWKEIEVLLNILEELRNPDAHRRDLLPYQKHLAIGISGKIRAEITEYFSNMETGESYYPRIESVQDSLGNTWAIGERNPHDTSCILRPGDQIQFNVAGTDPKGDSLEYTVLPNALPYEFEWKNNGNFDLTIQNKHVGKKLWVAIAIKSPRDFHATSVVGLGKVDDVVKFGFEVLPPR
ncbi:hypothetical protein ACJJIR_16005 [Microbulbifer sp. SSSA008]|uniref:hypothetical protein n=1 Tax=Microbulbifer sp. SSSA008 TaxID=3243380 RepID=UPI0040395ABE